MKVQDLLKEIKENQSQLIASQKDELRVMVAMLNDPEYKVGLYNKDGEQTGIICPREDALDIISRSVSSLTGVSLQEAHTLSQDKVFDNNDAKSFINISKQYILGYIETGRKLSFGKREDTDFSLHQEVVPEKYHTHPVKVGEKDGKPIYEHKKKDTPTPEHKVLKASSPCPSWLKK